MDELDKMIKELEYKFWEEKGVECGCLEKFKAYAFAALDRDADLQAALQLACADEEAAKHIDEDPIPGDSVLERQRYFTRPTEHVERDIQESP